MFHEECHTEKKKIWNDKEDKTWKSLKYDYLLILQNYCTKEVEYWYGRIHPCIIKKKVH